MASLGNGSLLTLPDLETGSTYTPTGGSALGSASILDFSGGGTEVDPKRYLNVGGTATAIQ